MRVVEQNPVSEDQIRAVVILIENCVAITGHWSPGVIARAIYSIHRAACPECRGETAAQTTHRTDIQ